MEIRKLAIGLALMVAGAGTLVWNEIRYGSTRDALAEMASAAVELGSIGSVDASANGRVVHVQGRVRLTAPTADPFFGVKGYVVSMNRTVEYRQWRKKQDADSTKGTPRAIYEQDWVSSPATGTSGAHANVTIVDPPAGKKIMSRNAWLGAYSLSGPILDDMRPETGFGLVMNQDARLALARTMVEQHPGVARRKAGLSSTADISEVVSQAAARLVHVNGSVLYLGANPRFPGVGDVRVTYRGVAPGEISLIATVDGGTLRPFKAGDGREVVSVAWGVKSVAEMTASQQKGNTSMAWFLRALGAVLAATGALFMAGRLK